MNQIAAILTRENDVWIVRVEKDKGKVQEYRCASEEKARQLTLILAPPPPQE